MSYLNPHNLTRSAVALPAFAICDLGESSRSPQFLLAPNPNSLTTSQPVHYLFIHQLFHSPQHQPKTFSLFHNTTFFLHLNTNIKTYGQQSSRLPVHNIIFEGHHTQTRPTFSFLPLGFGISTILILIRIFCQEIFATSSTTLLTQSSRRTTRTTPPSCLTGRHTSLPSAFSRLLSLLIQSLS